MEYVINPLALLDIEADNYDDISLDSIRYAKKRLLVELELESDNSLTVEGKAVHKSEVLELLNDLDDNLYYYWLLYKNTTLDKFLSLGELDYFYTETDEKLLTDDKFIDFLSPYFVKQYKYALLQAVINKDVGIISTLTSRELIVNKYHIDSCFKPTYNYIKRLLHRLTQINYDLRKKPLSNEQLLDIPWDKFVEIDCPTLNALPSYFSQLRYDIADKVLRLSVRIHNDYAFPAKDHILHSIAYNTMKSIAELNMGTSNRELYERDFPILEANYKQALEYEYSHIISKYEIFREKVSKLINQTESGQIDISQISSELIHCDYRELNSLPHMYVKVRNSVAIRLLNLAIALWNNQHELEVVNNIVGIVKLINVASSHKEEIDRQVQNFEFIRKQEYDRSEASSELVEKYKKLRSQVLDAKRKAYAGAADFSDISLCLNNCDPKEINSLPDKYADLKTSIAISFLNIAISAWNTYHKKEVAIEIVELIKCINVISEKKEAIDKEIKHFEFIRHQAEDKNRQKDNEEQQQYDFILKKVGNIKSIFKDNIITQPEIINQVHNLLTYNTLFSIKAWNSDERRNAIVENILHFLESSDNPHWQEYLVIPMMSKLAILTQSDYRIARKLEDFENKYPYIKKARDIYASNSHSDESPVTEQKKTSNTDVENNTSKK